MVHTATGINLKDIILDNKSESLEDMCYVTPF